MTHARQIIALAALGLVASVFLLVLSSVTGLIPVNQGRGYDGAYYAQMLESGFDSGPPGMRLRPAVLLINEKLNTHFFHDPLVTFRTMNVVYAAALAIILGALCRHYGGSPATVSVLVLNLFLCISITKMFAFYPVLVDLGAYALMAAATWAIVSGSRVWIVLTSLAAVSSREFGIVVAFFGVAREIRLRRPAASIAATYAPAIVVFFWIRQVATRYSSEIIGAGALLKNLEWWRDPLFGMFWVYFIVTVFGGVSLLLLTSTRPFKTCLRTEPEWFAMTGPLLVATALGSADMWRYAAFVVPAVAPFWAWSLADVVPRRRGWLFVTVSLATVATQRPWQRMDLESYFRDWFPYYTLMRERAPVVGPLWPTWHYYIVIAAVSLVVIALVRRWAAVPHTPSEQPGYFVAET